MHPREQKQERHVPSSKVHPQTVKFVKIKIASKGDRMFFSPLFVSPLVPLPLPTHTPTHTRAFLDPLLHIKCRSCKIQNTQRNKKRNELHLRNSHSFELLDHQLIEFRHSVTRVLFRTHMELFVVHKLGRVQEMWLSSSLSAGKVQLPPFTKTTRI